MKLAARILLLVVGLALLLPGICSIGCTVLWIGEGAPSITRDLGMILPFWIPGLMLGALGVLLLRYVNKRWRQVDKTGGG